MELYFAIKSHNCIAGKNLLSDYIFIQQDNRILKFKLKKNDTH